MATKKAKSSTRSTTARRPASSRTAKKQTDRSTRSKTSRRPASSRTSRELTDHDEIQAWAEEREAVPSCVKKTGGRSDVGMIRLNFPGYSGEESLQEISWDDWFEKFDENNLALLVQDKTARGQKSNFNKLVQREASHKRPKTRAAG